MFELRARTIGLIVLVAASFSTPVYSQSWRYRRLESALKATRWQYQMPGVAAAVVEDGRVVWRFSSGNLSPDTLHDVASLTKTMASVLVFQEIEAGRLKLTDPVPGLPGVQVKHLLSHTSGPAHEFHYDNARFHLLTSLLERRAGSRFPDLLRHRIFAPAGMDSSRPSLSAAAGVLATLDDLARYAAALDSRQLLRDRSKSLMWTPARPDIPYGLGWFATTRHEQKVAWHYGLDGASSSLIIKVPAKRLSLIVIASSAHLGEEFHQPRPDLFRSRIARAFLDTSFDQFEGLLVSATPALQR
ncbi:MAG: beta-lactamase family protein [Bryobacteraceae bacterium]|nr:beta-lactamase family protein [Bryobacteraceae bacterium]